MLRIGKIEGSAMGVKHLFDLSGKIALVTGGSRGLGLQMAKALGEMGADIAISARKRDETPLNISKNWAFAAKLSFQAWVSATLLLHCRRPHSHDWERSTY